MPCFSSLARYLAFVEELNSESSSDRTFNGIPILTDTFTPRMCRRFAVEHRSCISPTRLFHCLGVLKLESIVQYTFSICTTASGLKRLLLNTLFFRPLENVATHQLYVTSVYSGSQPIGKYAIDHKLSRICALAGVEGRITNHSLRATSATEMYEMGVPEKVIQERNGHHSLEALRVYGSSNAHQQEAVSNALSDLQVRTYSEQHGFARQTMSTSITVIPSRDCLFPSKTSTDAPLTSTTRVQPYTSSLIV